MENHKIRKLLESTGALATGHFDMGQGRHTNTWLRPVKVLQFPPFCRKVAYEAVKHYWDMDVQLVVAASPGAILFAAEFARQLEARVIFTTDERDAPAVALHPDFEIHSGDRIVLVEDILGDAYPNLRALARQILKQDARLIGTASLFDTAGQTNILQVRQISTLKCERAQWSAAECPHCAAGRPLDTPPGP